MTMRGLVPSARLFVARVLGAGLLFGLCMPAAAEDEVPNPSVPVTHGMVRATDRFTMHGDRLEGAGGTEHVNADVPQPTAAVSPAMSSPAISAPTNAAQPAKLPVFRLEAPDLPPIVVDLSVDHAPLASLPPHDNVEPVDRAAPATIMRQVRHDNDPAPNFSATSVPNAAAALQGLHDRPAMMGPEPAGPAVAPDLPLDAQADALKSQVQAWVAAPAARGADKRRKEAVATFYEARAYRPLWIRSQQWSVQAKGVQARLEKADEDGLSLTLPPLPQPREASAAQAELLLSDLVTQYIAQAHGSRIEPGAVSHLITARPSLPDFGRWLSTLENAERADAMLQSANPPQRGYEALRQKLAELRRESAPQAATTRIPAGPVLKVGMSDARVPLIRARLGLESSAVSSDTILYDTKLAAAVADFQTSSGLPSSGTLTARTIALLSGGQASRLEADLIASMEAWRWLPRSLGRDHIEVNIPDYVARLYRDNALAYETRVVVGKVDTPTPVFSSRMTFLIVNPYWNVPLSIIKKEMLPKLAADPDYFSRRGYELVQNGGQIVVRQPPGDANALGRIKFMFPNEHAVYLHDTPSKSLFGQAQRAFSHGCVRVDQPFRFAEAVLGGAWSEQKVRALIGGEERTLNLPEPLPIHIMYMTARVDENGRLQLRNDVYGYMHKVKALLGLDG